MTWYRIMSGENIFTKSNIIFRNRILMLNRRAVLFDGDTTKRILRQIPSQDLSPSSKFLLSFWVFCLIFVEILLF